MNANRIDFISSYCDRWCERCSFTSRCSLFAVQTAIAMCGDVADGIELAVGRPPDEPHAHHSFTLSHQRIDDLEDSAMALAERLEFDSREQELNARVDNTTIMYIARAFSVLAHQWLTARADSVRHGADHVVQESLEIAAHDALFINAKLRRALSGRDPYEPSDDQSHPIQNDCNGSAKVSLIAIERSEAAWRVIADATGEDTPAMLADELRNLKWEVETVFPKAWSFVRPGFDEPWR
jgi:hypothetical protein